MHGELLAIAGFVLFLCVLGARGLMICALVGFGVLVFWANQERMITREMEASDARLRAECIAHPPTNEVDRFLCNPPR